ncbi:MAG: flagellar hook-basal body complex protein FliE [Robiginitomaculum sp.]|nr:MAG: flagellar hook-basal body complex protein FliE [Robiginitomaculum sp.]
MSFSALTAINAYAQAAQAGKTSDATGAAALELLGKEAGGTDFGAMVKEAISSAATATAGAEKMTVAAVTGQAELVDVVTSLAEAEIQLETVIAIRDEMIKAYQDILRMPI